MGGRGSGGSRPGSGKKGEAAVAFDGPLEDVQAPTDLTKAERKIWDELSPLAAEQRTLTPTTAYRFRVLCRWILLERRLGRSREEAGRTNHRGATQRVEAGMIAFRLAPIGKPLATPKTADTVKSPLEQLQAARPALYAVKK